MAREERAANPQDCKQLINRNARGGAAPATSSVCALTRSVSRRHSYGLRRNLARTSVSMSMTDREAADRSTSGEEPEAPAPIIDETICYFCQADNGETPQQKVAGIPACASCVARLRRPSLPSWLTTAGAVIAVLVVVTFARNWRFVMAEVEAIRAGRASQAGDMPTAVALMTSAANRVPEVQGLADTAAFLRGIELFDADRAAEAIPWLRKAAEHAPSDSAVQLYLISAESGAAFDAHDYDRFLDFSQRLMSLTPNESSAVAQVASAYACKYAVSGDEAFRQAAVEHLHKAESLATNRAAHDEYAERINHRLSSREIITKREYDARFRNVQAARD